MQLSRKTTPSLIYHIVYLAKRAVAPQDTHTQTNVIAESHDGNRTGRCHNDMSQ